DGDSDGLTTGKTCAGGDSDGLTTRKTATIGDSDGLTTPKTPTSNPCGRTPAHFLQNPRSNGGTRRVEPIAKKAPTKTRKSRTPAKKRPRPAKPLVRRGDTEGLTDWKKRNLKSQNSRVGTLRGPVCAIRYTENYKMNPLS